MYDQYHLNGKRMSKRAVRVEELEDSLVTSHLQTAAKLTPKEGTFLDLKKRQFRLGLRDFVKEISDPCDDPLKANWKKLSHADWDDPKSIGFTAKDLQVLEQLYRDYHEVTQDEVDAITGKAVPVASED